MIRATLLALLLAIPAAGAPRIAMTWGIPEGTNRRWDAGEIEALDRVDLFANVYTVGTMQQLEARRPGRKYLWQMQIGTVPVHDYATWKMPAWMLPDTSINPDYLLMWHVQKERERGHDWLLYDTEGRPISIWDGSRLCLNWTQAAPIGSYGDSKGMRPANYTAKLLRRFLADPAWPWHLGVWIDNGPPWGLREEFRDVDANRDGAPDSWSLREREELRGATVFWRDLLSGLPAEQIVVAGRMEFPVAFKWKMSGHKKEEFWWGIYGPDRFCYRAEWAGGLHMVGYKQAEDMTCRVPQTPENDPLQGADWTFINAQVPPWQWTDERIAQYTTCAYAFSLLENGWYCGSMWGSNDSPPLPPAVSQWHLGEPIGAMYWGKDSRHHLASLMCREYEYPGNPIVRTVSVCVDTVEGRGFLVSGRIPSP